MTKEELKELKHELDTYGGGIGTADALKLIAEIERLQSEREWRPIETVPEEVKKDGTMILLTGCNGHPLVVPAVYREPVNTDNFNSFWYGYAPGCGVMALATPTHWMPLPDAPKGGKE